MIKNYKHSVPLLFLIGIAGIMIVTGHNRANRPNMLDKIGNALTPTSASAQSLAPNGAIADVAEKVVSSVVNISATKITRSAGRNRLSPFHSDPLFRDFFRKFDSVPSERRQRSLGSGVLVSRDGIILTNNHVVEQTQDIRVTLTNGGEYDAEVVGTDPKSDVAVIRLKGNIKNLKPLRFGDSDSMRLGEVVLAIGNPFGVGQTITMGIISAKGRANVGIVDYENFIQTDAAINPGNSGGALVNLRGELIGINTAILSRSGGYQGVGFAIPSNMARAIMGSLVKNGKVVRGWLGVAIQAVDKSLANALGLQSTDGVLIANVQSGSPAANAGVLRGDVVIYVNKTKIRSPSHLRNVIASQSPKSRVALQVLRNGKSKTITVALGSLPGPRTATHKANPNKQNKQLAGLQVVNLTPQTRQQFRVPNQVQSGVVVAAVTQGSKADRAGIRPGDVIIELNRQPISTSKSFYRAAKRGKSELLLLVQRGDAVIYLVLHDK